MALSLRLDRDTERELGRYARLGGVSKSRLVRSLITEYVAGQSGTLSPWELGKGVFGRAGSGRGDLSLNRKSLLKEKLRARRNSR